MSGHRVIKTAQTGKPSPSDIGNIFVGGPLSSNIQKGKERFIKPTSDQVVKAAIVFNDGRMNRKELTNMVALADFIIERLYEHGDMSIPASNEK